MAVSQKLLQRVMWSSTVLMALLLTLLYWLAPKPVKETIRWDSVRLTSAPPIPMEQFLRQVKVISNLGEELELSPETLKNLFDALKKHPWVESVTRTRWLGPILEAEVQFRIPAARMVRDGEEYVVDRQGQLLLLKDLTVPTESLPVIEGLPPGQLSPKDTKLLQAAATIAYLIRDDVVSWKVNKILVHAQTHLLLHTHGGRYIWWQSINEGESILEASEELKRARLSVYRDQHGTLECGDLKMIIDLRPPEGLQLVSHSQLFEK